MSEVDSEDDVARCHYTGKPVETTNDVSVSISREAAISMIVNGDTRLG
ncbi:hypothetical protein [Natrinema sp. H-ect4]